MSRYVDVEPVVHASWEVRLVCSNCGHLAVRFSSLCPDCEAKMDEEEK